MTILDGQTIFKQAICHRYVKWPKGSGINAGNPPTEYMEVRKSREATYNTDLGFGCIGWNMLK